MSICAECQWDVSTYARAALYASSMLENKLRRLASASKRHVIAERFSANDSGIRVNIMIGRERRGHLAILTIHLYTQVNLGL